MKYFLGKRFTKNYFIASLLHVNDREAVMRRGIVLWVVIALAATGCASGSPPSVAPAAQSAAQPPALPESIRWVQSSAEYMAATVQAYRMATTRVETAARGRAAGSWAVILDADETV